MIRIHPGCALRACPDCLLQGSGSVAPTRMHPACALCACLDSCGGRYTRPEAGGEWMSFSHSLIHFPASAHRASGHGGGGGRIWLISSMPYEKSSSK